MEKLQKYQNRRIKMIQEKPDELSCTRPIHPSVAGVIAAKVTLEEGSKMRDLLARLGLPTEERGITFINGELSAMPNMQSDLDHELCAGDRPAFFHLRSTWPFQYRFRIRMAAEMSQEMHSSKDQRLHHSYEESKS